MKKFILLFILLLGSSYLLATNRLEHKLLTDTASLFIPSPINESGGRDKKSIISDMDQRYNVSSASLDNPCTVTVLENTFVTVSGKIVSAEGTTIKVYGNMKVKADGNIAPSPYYFSTSNLIYDYESTSGNTGNFWGENAATLSEAGCPYNVMVNSGTLNIDQIDSDAEKLYIANNLTVISGATLYLDMLDGSSPYDQNGINVTGDIVNNGTITMSSTCQQALACHNFTNTGSATVALNANAFGGDLSLTGNFINNSTSANNVNFNGRALKMTGNANQSIGGTATGTYVISNLWIDKTGGTVTVQKDLLCEGNPNSALSGISVNGAILDISDRKVTVAKKEEGNYSTITTNTSGFIRTNAATELTVLGDESLLKNTGTIRFDQTTPGSTNVIGKFELNRIANQAELVVANSFIVDNTLKISRGKLTCQSDLQLNAGAIGTLSSTLTTAALETNRLIFCKNTSTSAQFYKNGRTLTINTGVRTKVTFDQTAKWHFIAFPYSVTAVKKSDGTTAAVLGTDYSLGWYDAATRATNKSGWKTSTDHPMTAGKGYIINKKSPLEELYFDGSVSGTHSMFNSTTNIGITYTTGSPYALCNFGWNFVAHPLSAQATPSLTVGEFAYNYNPLFDTYKLWYGQYNTGYTYGGSGMIPFDAYFIKTASAANLSVSYSLTSPQGVRQKENLQPQDLVQLNLFANGNNYETLVRILPQATPNYDEMYDAPYSEPMNAVTPRIYTMSNENNALALNTVPEETQVPVYLKVPQAGEYSFNWNVQLTNLPVTLIDMQTGETVDLTAETQYSFQTSTPEVKNRFYLNVPRKIITENVGVENTDRFLKIYSRGGNIEVQGLKGDAQIYLFDMAGRILQKGNTGNNNWILNIPVAGVYLLSIKDDRHTNFIKKVVVH